jgi:hypothetical protein
MCQRVIAALASAVLVRGDQSCTRSTASALIHDVYEALGCTAELCNVCVRPAALFTVCLCASSTSMKGHGREHANSTGSRLRLSRHGER